MKYQRGGISESSTTSDNTSQFIDIVKKHDVVYNTHHSDYKNVEVKTKVWSQIAAEIGLSIDASKRKWKNLRDSYTKYLRSFRVGTKTSKKYQYWAHADHMEFLKPYQGPGRCRSSATLKANSQDDENECDLGYQVLAKASDESDDVKVNVVANSMGTAASNINSVGNNCEGSIASIANLPSILPHINTANASQCPTNNMTHGGISVTPTSGVVLTMPSLPTVQLPPSLISMPILGGGMSLMAAITNTPTFTTSNVSSVSSTNTTSYSILNTANGTNQLPNLPSLSTKSYAGITMPSSSASSSVGCMIIKPQQFISDTLKKDLNNATNLATVTCFNSNSHQYSSGCISATGITGNRFNSLPLAELRRVQLSPQMAAINLSFPTPINTQQTYTNNMINNNNKYIGHNSVQNNNNGFNIDCAGNGSDNNAPSPAKIRKQCDLDITTILQANRHLDANTLFFLSLARQVRAMPIKFQSIAKMRCMRIVSDIELELDNVMNDTTYTIGTKYMHCGSDSSPNSTQQPPPPPPLAVFSDNTSNTTNIFNNNNNSNNSFNNLNGITTNETQPEHFVYVMSPSRVEGMIDISSDDENTANAL